MNNSLRRTALSLAIAASLATLTAYAAPPAQTLPPARATGGIRLGERTLEGYLDLIAPLASNGNNLWFFNPRLSAIDNGAQELNLGLGYRTLVANDKAIVGVNAYYDSRWTAYNHHVNQWGLGLEALTDSVDARINYYRPEDKRYVIASADKTTVDTLVQTNTYYDDPYAVSHRIDQQGNTTTTTTTTTTHQYYNRYEQGMKGYDAEVGVKLPLKLKLTQVKVFGGYYNYDDPYGGHIQGPKARLEIRARDYLTFDAELYNNKDLNGTRYFVGVRFNAPFDLGRLFKGENPFKFTPSPQHGLKGRLTDMVMRDVRVQAAHSNYIEDVSARTQNTDTNVQTNSSTKVLLDDVNFVNNGNTTGNENGTAEHPYSTVQKGVDNAFGLENVYVFGMTDHGYTPGTYSENVTVSTGVTLIGSGQSIVGGGNKAFGGSTYPTVDGHSNGPAVTVNSNTTVEGLQVVNSGSGSGVTSATLPDGNSYDTTRAGIFGNNLSGTVTVNNNKIENVTYGVLLGDSGTTITINSNTVSASGDNHFGIGVVKGGSGVLNLTETGNTINTSGSSAYGQYLYNGDTGMINATLSGNTVTTNKGTAYGQYLWNYGGGTINATVSGNTVTTSNGNAYGQYLYNSGTGTFNATLSGNTVSTNGSSAYGQYLWNHGGGTINATVSGNTVTTSKGNAFGQYLYNSSTGTFNATLSGNAVNTSGNYAYGQHLDNSGTGALNATLSGNTVNTSGNYAYGQALYNDGGGTFNATVSGNTVTTSGDNSIGQLLDSAGGTFNATVSGNTVTTSGGIAYGQGLWNDYGGTFNATLANNTVASSQSDAVYENISYGTHCLNAYGNQLTYASGSYGFNLIQAHGSFYVEQTSVTDLTNQNNGASVNTSGTITYNHTCP